MKIPFTPSPMRNASSHASGIWNAQKHRRSRRGRVCERRDSVPSGSPRRCAIPQLGRSANMMIRSASVYPAMATLPNTAARHADHVLKHSAQREPDKSQHQRGDQADLMPGHDHAALSTTQEPKLQQHTAPAPNGSSDARRGHAQPGEWPQSKMSKGFRMMFIQLAVHNTRIASEASPAPKYAVDQEQQDHGSAAAVDGARVAAAGRDDLLRCVHDP